MTSLSRVVKRLLVWAILLTCLHRLIWRITRRRGLTIIYYHNPDPATFERHIAFLAKHYTFLSLDDLERILESRDWRKAPPSPMVVTIDDGHADNRGLTGIIERYRVPAAIYLTAGVIGTQRRFWFKSTLFSPLEFAKLKALGDSERRLLLAAKWRHTDTREYERETALSWEDVQAWTSAGGQVGAHSLFHPILTKCSQATAFTELVESKATIEHELGGAKVKHFAYPNGDWNAAIAAMVCKAGYKSARTTRHGWVTLHSNPFALPAMAVSDDADVGKLALQVTGVWHVIRTARLPTFGKA